MDDTAASFPTYADLTQTQGWDRAAAFDPTIDAPLSDDRALRYTQGALLGKGGMGMVTLARDARIGRDVAVKELHATGVDEESRARFMREARVQGQLEHPSIVPVYDIEQRADGTTFFTMRRVLGKTLHAVIEELRAGSTKYTQRELLTVVSTVCLTIDYAHTRGVVHRDLKPANIMLGDFGEVYVLDWGLARIVDAPDGGTPFVDEPATRLSVTGALLGTPLYMAPEQISHPDVGRGADIWALGALLFELLTHERLRDAQTVYVLPERRPSVRAPQRDVAPELEAIIVRATAEDPAARYPTARALHEAIASYLEGDRDQQMRRESAAAHARAAREALARSEQPGADYERERGIATNELLKTVGLDPDNAEYGATLATVLQSRPKILPAAVAAQISAGEQEVVRTAAKLSVVALVLWFACLPGVLWIGLRSVPALLWILVPAGLTMILSWYAARARHIRFWMQTGMVVGTLLGAVATSRLYGPLVLTPTLIATFTIVLQAHPMTSHRTLAIVLGTVAFLAPIGLELAGVLPRSYLFADGKMQILPQMIALPEVASSVFLALASLAMVWVPGAFIKRLRVSLSEAETQLMLQAWHLEQLTKRPAIPPA